MKDRGATLARRARFKGPGGVGCILTGFLSTLMLFSGLALILPYFWGVGTDSVVVLLGAPLIILAVIIPVVMSALSFSNEIAGPCPYCGVAIKTADTIAYLNCPACKSLVIVQGKKLLREGKAKGGSA